MTNGHLKKLSTDCSGAIVIILNSRLSAPGTTVSFLILLLTHFLSNPLLLGTMKAIYFLLIAGILSLSLPAQSQEFPFCYMQTATGQVISLDNLCRQPLEANGNLTPDQVFQQLILQEATNSDKEFLQGQGGMEEAIAKAKEFCSDYSKGLSKNQAFQAIAEESFIGGGSKKLNSYLTLINTVGNRVYCPAS